MNFGLRPSACSRSNTAAMRVMAYEPRVIGQERLMAETNATR